MSFRDNCIATVWGTPKAVTPGMTKIKITTSEKNSEGHYETDFSDFVTIVGRDAASAALDLKERDRIRLGKVEVTTKYKKETDQKFWNCRVFGFGKVTYGNNNQKGNYSGGRSDSSNGGYGNNGYNNQNGSAYNNYSDNRSAGYDNRQNPSNGTNEGMYVDNGIELSNDDLPF